MCVDDYQFRHYSAIKPKQCRRFIFINEDDIQKTFLVNISQFQEDGQVALCKIINHLSSKGLLANKRTFFLPKLNITIKFGENCKVPFWTLQEKQIIFRASVAEENQEDSKNWQGFNNFNCLQDIVCQKKEQTSTELVDSKKCESQDSYLNNLSNQVKDEDEEYLPNLSLLHNDRQFKVSQKNGMGKSFEEKSSKRNKESQRSILQVLTALKKWRKLFQNKKLNLTKAAKVIGISKKSLDDYYLVVRIGEVLRFDFQSHLNGKMGDLRSFIKKFENKVTGKLTKRVQCFKLLPEIDLDSLVKYYQQTSKQVTELIQEQ